MVTKNRWKDREVKAWAKAYLKGTRENLMGLEEKLGVSHSTLWWCFQNRLYLIDVGLYVRVLERLDYNKRNKVRRSN